MSQPSDWKKLLRADPSDWLLEPEEDGHGSSGVRYLTLRDIVDAGEKEINEAREKVYHEGPIARIMAEMSPEGYWITPGLGYGPKFKSTVWSLLSLAQLGASSKENKRIHTACCYLLDHALAKGGQFTYRRPTGWGLCLQGNLLTALMDLGCQDERLNMAYEWMARRLTGENLPRKINADGLPPGEGISGPFYYVKFIVNPLFGCRTNKGLSCGWAGVSVMMAFSRLPVTKRSDLVKRAIKVGTDFFFSTDPATGYFHDSKTGVPDTKWWDLKFPDFYAADVLKLAEALTALGYGNDPRLKNTLNWIRSRQDEKGRWPIDYIDRVRKMWVEYGTRGQPNKWVTLRAMRLLKRAAEQ